MRTGFTPREVDEFTYAEYQEAVRLLQAEDEEARKAERRR